MRYRCAHHFLGDGACLLRPRQIRRQRERVQGAARIAARHKKQRLPGVIFQGKRSRQAPLAFQGMVEDGRKGFIAQAMQLDNARTRDQRRVHLEKRVFGGGADQDHHPIFDSMEQGILLSTVEAMNFIHEQDGADTAVYQALVCFGYFTAQIGHRAANGGNLDEMRMRGFGDNVRDGGLARSRRPVQDHRGKGVGLYGATQPRAFAQGIFLADKVVERLRAHAHGKRGICRALVVFYVSEKCVHTSTLP